MTGSTTHSARRTRRRGAELLHAIHTAVRAELADHGYPDVTFEGVARRARVSKPVLYSRYHSRAQMLADALVSELTTEPMAASTGALRSDLQRTFDRFMEPSRRVGPATLRALLGDADEELSEQVTNLALTPALESLELCVREARARGELGPAPLPRQALMAPVTLLQTEALHTRVSPHYLDGVIDDVAIPLWTTLAADRNAADSDGSARTPR